jgi:anti-sigma regulatory factor (Ser/Thr protein kinase)
LVAARWLDRIGGARRPAYRPGPLRQLIQVLPLQGLDEDLPWKREVAPLLDLPPHVALLVEHAYTELLNNAVDHSGGRQATISVRQTPTHVQLLVADDGCGIFDRIARSFAIDDPATAMLELAKGKLSTWPARHSGRGLFFVARLAEVFELHANRHAYRRFGWEGGGWDAGRPLPRDGTSVFVAIALETSSTLEGLLSAHSASGRGRDFARTEVALRLLASPGASLATRAQARRAWSRLAAFEHATLDFGGIAEVGPAFADELLRVQRVAYPGVRLETTRVSPRVHAVLEAVG